MSFGSETPTGHFGSVDGGGGGSGFGEDVTVLKANSANTPRPILQLINDYVAGGGNTPPEKSSWTVKVLQAGAQVTAAVFGGLGSLFPAGFFDGVAAHSVAGIAVGTVGFGLLKFANQLGLMVNGLEYVFFAKTSGSDGSMEIDGTFAKLMLNGAGDCSVERTVDAGSNQSNLSLIGRFNSAQTDVVIGANGALANNANGGFLQLPTMPGIPTGAPNLNTGKQAIVIANTAVAAQLYRWTGAAWVAGPLV